MNVSLDKAKHDSLNITIGVEEEKNCIIYGKHLRNFKRIKVEKIFSYLSPPHYDALILPVPSSYGLFGVKSSILSQLVRLLGADFLATVQDYIVRKYLGEQPVGSAFVLKSPCPLFKYIIVVAAVRIVSWRGDENAWLDPGYVPIDFAYTSLRAALLSILRLNASTKTQAINSIFCPDLFAIRKEWLGGELLNDEDFDLLVQQLILAMESIFHSSKNPKTWSEGIILQRQILDKEKKQKREDILHMLVTGTLEQRGLYTMDELELIMGCLKNDSRTRLAAARVIAYSITRVDSHFNIPKNDILHRITDKNAGCLGHLVDLAIERSISLHTEIPFEELEISHNEEIGEGTAGNVYRGLWKEQRVAI